MSWSHYIHGNDLIVAISTHGAHVRPFDEIYLHRGAAEAYATAGLPPTAGEYMGTVRPGDEHWAGGVDVSGMFPGATFVAGGE